MRLAVVAALVLLAGITLGSCGDDLGQGSVAQGSCTDFSNQAEAQRAANTLDGDDDGRYCERLPCPCAGPGGSSGDSGSGSTNRSSTPTPAGQAPPGERLRESPGSNRSGAPASVSPATITHVVDGDTVDARLEDGSERRVRLLGVDTPEKTALRSGRAECGGQDATQFTESLARRWPAVVLRTDPSQDAVDRYGRLLAYIDSATEPGRSYQQELLTQGWAKVYVFERRPVGRIAAFRGAAAMAQREGRGVWRRCGGDFRRPLPG